MDYSLFIAFILTSVALIVVPGPNVLVVVSTSVSHGSRRGLQTVMGTSSAMLIQLLIAAFGTTWFVAAIANGFEWLRWSGVAYLIFLGSSYLMKLTKQNNNAVVELTASGTFLRGFIVSLTNPKTILFFSAFLPQFVSRQGDYAIQIAILSITFLVLATLLDGLYAIFAGRITRLIQTCRVHKIQNGLSGILYFGAGIWLAVLRRG
jgi:homoserine/homoserine lactone efflux protein